MHRWGASVAVDGGGLAVGAEGRWRGCFDDFCGGTRRRVEAAAAGRAVVAGVMVAVDHTDGRGLRRRNIVVGAVDVL